MKKVLLFIDNLGSGGAQRQLVNIAVLLKERGYDVSMLVYNNNPFYKKILDDAKITVTLIKNKGVFSRIKNVRHFIRHAKVDVVIAFLETPGFIACLSKLGGGDFKLITNELSAKQSTFLSKRNRIFNIFERYSDAKICNSQNAMKMWQEHYPQYNNKYGVIYNPVIITDDVVNRDPQPRNTDRLRLTVAASYQELKNPLRVIEALHMLRPELRERLDLQWYGRAEVTEGNTEIYDEAQKRIKDLCLESCICLNSETKDIYNIMADSDAIGLFSTVEGLPNAICEGMMLGKPIIMSRVSDYEILAEGNGFLCDPMSAESIKKAIEELLSVSPDKLADMGKLSREKAEKFFSKEAVIGQWIELIEELTK